MNIIGYLRVSTEEQANEGYSISAQKQEIQRYAKLKKAKVKEWFIDEGLSASTIKRRPAMMSLLSYIKRTKVDELVVIKIDRLSRDTKNSMEILNELESRGIRLKSLRENVNVSTNIGKAMYQIISSFAEFERNKLQSNVSRGMKQKASEGGWLGGLIYGYDSELGTVSINKKESEIINLMYGLYLTGWTYKDIAWLLNSSDIKTKKGNKFSLASVRGILQNRFYIGEYTTTFKGEFIIHKNHHEPVIPDVIWKLSQFISERKRATLFPVFWATGIIPCQDCGSPMSSVFGKKGHPGYYVCSKKKKSKSLCMRSVYFSKDVYEEYIISKTECNIQPFLDSLTSEEIKQVVTLLTKSTSTLNEVLSNAIYSLSKKTERLQQALKSTAAGSKEINNKLISLEEEKKQLIAIRTEVHLSSFDLFQSFEQLPDRTKKVLSTLIYKWTTENLTNKKVITA